MPIYAYKCASCGHAKDVLQKMSDDPLTVCPACGAATFGKQLTAAGFQLKGSGWYATDFRGGTTAPAADKAADTGTGDAKTGESKPADAKPADASPAKPDAGPAPAKSDAPSASAGGSGASRAGR
ncbi:MAG: FmdB family zinc ribbon protein [Ramlibacter sp.]